MITRAIIILLLLLGATGLMCFNSPVTIAETSSGENSKEFLDKIAGVYRNRFTNHFVRPEDGTYQSEDVLEVVPLDEKTAYVRMSLQFFNGHSGAIYGVATIQGRTLVYDNTKVGADHCVVQYIWGNKEIVTKADYDETPGCSYYHGARGSLNGAQFKRSSKRAIRYMTRLKASKEFQEATENYRTRVAPRKMPVAPTMPSTLNSEKLKP